MSRRWLIAFIVCPFLSAQQFAHYDIYRAASPVVVDGKLDEPAWKQAPSVGDFHPVGDEAEVQQQTIAKLAWDDENLYVGYYCLDRRISAYINERHGPVSQDDCVELFLSPNPSNVRNYYTFEINVIGAMLNRNRTSWWTGPPTWEPDGVKYRTTWHGQPKKDVSSDDEHWIVEMAVPLRNFANDAVRIPPAGGDEWRLNLNRLEGTEGIRQPRGQPRAGLSTWSPLPKDVRTFHSPDWFGWVRFVASPPPK